MLTVCLRSLPLVTKLLHAGLSPCCVLFTVLASSSRLHWAVLMTSPRQGFVTRLLHENIQQPTDLR